MIDTAPLETVARTAALGMRFWDSVTGRSAAEGLEVYESSSGTRAVATTSNVYVFGDLPGLRRCTFSSDGPAFWSSPPSSARFTFEVIDRDERFLPFRFEAEAPHRGLFVPSCVAESEPSVVNCIPVFSAPGRPSQPGLGIVRADLWDVRQDAPAAGAVLEISMAGSQRSHGIADQRGRVVVQAPYPEPRWQGGSPPPGSTALLNQSWSVDAAVRYRPFAAGPMSPTAALSPPDLCRLLTQPPATLLESDSPTTALPAQLLYFGRELILRSTGRSVLLVLPI
jgi:hypothetical protein